MLKQPEDPFARGERHVRESEARIPHYRALIEELDRNMHPEETTEARKLLATLQYALDLTREHLRLEREMKRAETNLSGAASGG